MSLIWLNHHRTAVRTIWLDPRRRRVYGWVSTHETVVGGLNCLLLAIHPGFVWGFLPGTRGAVTYWTGVHIVRAFISLPVSFFHSILTGNSPGPIVRYIRALIYLPVSFFQSILTGNSPGHMYYRYCTYPPSIISLGYYLSTLPVYIAVLRTHRWRLSRRPIKTAV
jgi:hypothetical protein